MNYQVKPEGKHEIKASIYADDLAIIGYVNELQQMVNTFHDACMKWV